MSARFVSANMNQTVEHNQQTEGREKERIQYVGDIFNKSENMRFWMELLEVPIHLEKFKIQFAIIYKFRYVKKRLPGYHRIGTQTNIYEPLSQYNTKGIIKKYIDLKE